MKITAAVATAPQSPFELRSVELESPRPDEVLVKIVGTGLCHTDLIARDQFIPIQLPAVLGHEGAGIVQEVGPDITDLDVGDHVVISFSSCGSCARCDDALPSYCQFFPERNYAGCRPDGSTPITEDGVGISAAFFGQSSFASHAVAPRRNVVKIDKSVPLELMGPLGCGVQTGVGGIMRSLACEAGSSLAIFGGGTVGLSAVMGGRIQNCATIILVEPIQARRDLALDLGATHVIDPNAVADVTEAIRAIVPLGVDYAFENSGLPKVVESAMACLGSHGTLGLVGVPPNPEDSVSVNLAQAITFGHQIKGIIEGDSDLETFIPEMIELYKTGQLPIEKIVTRVPFNKINEAIAAQHRGEFIKVVLIPE